MYPWFYIAINTHNNLKLCFGTIKEISRMSYELIQIDLVFIQIDNDFFAKMGVYFGFWGLLWDVSNFN